MASCTRAWRPSGRGSTASKAESTSLALAAMAPFNCSWDRWATARNGGVLTAPDKLSDIMPHLTPHGGRLAPGRKPSSHRPLLAPNPSVLPAGSSHLSGISQARTPGLGIHAQVGVAPSIPKGENGYVAAPHQCLVRPSPD